LKARANAANKQLPAGGGLSAKHGKSDKNDRSGHARSFAPYHRRTTVTTSTELSSSVAVSVTSDMDFALPTASGSSKGIPLLRNTVGSGGLGGVNPDSPHSTAPSPLMASQTQPSVSQNCDPMMPTLSPHPPSKNDTKDGGGGGGGGGGHEMKTGGVAGGMNSLGSSDAPHVSNATSGSTNMIHVDSSSVTTKPPTSMGGHQTVVTGTGMDVKVETLFNSTSSSSRSGEHVHVCIYYILLEII